MLLNLTETHDGAQTFKKVFFLSAFPHTEGYPLHGYVYCSSTAVLRKSTSPRRESVTPSRHRF